MRDSLDALPGFPGLKIECYVGLPSESAKLAAVVCLGELVNWTSRTNETLSSLVGCRRSNPLIIVASSFRNCDKKRPAEVAWSKIQAVHMS